MSNAKPVDEEPHVVLTDWLVVRAHDTGCLHFVGRKPDGKYRTSSAIEEFDTHTMSGRTQSGRFYRLEGDPAEDRRPAAAVIAMNWGIHMLDHVSVVDAEHISIMTPARGMA